MIKPLINLFYPKTCYACSTELVNNEFLFCFSCESSIPRATNNDKSPIKYLFWGKYEVDNVFIYTYYLKGSLIEYSIQQLKYFHQKRIGKWVSMKLKKIVDRNYFDFITCVPMHPVKKRKRGYNQSELIALNLSKELNIKYIKCLAKINNSKTQTKKSKYHRYQDSTDNYEIIKNLSFIENKKILLIDDVITTGATIDICSKLLIQKAGCHVSIAAFAWTPDDHILLHAS